MTIPQKEKGRGGAKKQSARISIRQRGKKKGRKKVFLGTVREISTGENCHKKAKTERV